jgi:hypothetical protein
MKTTLIKIFSVILVVALIFMAGFFAAGCIRYPTRSETDIDACYDYQVCLYYVARGNLKSNCNEEFQKCCKARNFIFCGNEKNRPADVKFQECWDKLQ